eukprot:gb/GECG01005261.1/.p1 GENE.gb/GECG01005261.1/~~gb/GECG01005261.1/.p1  ORF type:complete len:1371 (+),score=150.72 gb/GECG01005261.1/:1-4113(+)
MSNLAVDVSASWLSPGSGPATLNTTTTGARDAPAFTFSGVDDSQRSDKDGDESSASNQQDGNQHKKHSKSIRRTATAARLADMLGYKRTYENGAIQIQRIWKGFVARTKILPPLSQRQKVTSSWGQQRLFQFCLQLQNAFYSTCESKGLPFSEGTAASTDNSDCGGRRQSIPQLDNSTRGEVGGDPDHIRTGDIHDLTYAGKIRKRKGSPALDIPFATSPFGYCYTEKLNEGTVFVLMKIAGLLTNQTTWSSIRQLFSGNASINFLESSLQHLHWGFRYFSSSVGGRISSDECSRLIHLLRLHDLAPMEVANFINSQRWFPWQRIRAFVEQHADQMFEAMCRSETPLVATDLIFSALDFNQFSSFLRSLSLQMRPPDNACPCNGCRDVFRNHNKTYRESSIESLVTPGHENYAVQKCLEHSLFPAVDRLSPFLTQVVNYDWYKVLMSTRCRDTMCSMETSFKHIYEFYSGALSTQSLMSSVEESQSSQKTRIEEGAKVSFQQLWLLLYDFGIVPSIISSADVRPLSIHCRLGSVSAHTGCSHGWELEERHAPNLQNRICRFCGTIKHENPPFEKFVLQKAWRIWKARRTSVNNDVRGTSIQAFLEACGKGMSSNAVRNHISPHILASEVDFESLWNALLEAEQNHYECAVTKFSCPEVVLLMGVVGHIADSMERGRDDPSFKIRWIFYDVIAHIYEKVFDETLHRGPELSILTQDKDLPEIKADVRSRLCEQLPLYGSESEDNPGEPVVDIVGFREFVSDLRVFRSLTYSMVIDVFTGTKRNPNARNASGFQVLNKTEFVHAVEELMIECFLLGKQQEHHATRKEYYEPISARTGWTPESICYRVLAHRLRLLCSMYPPSAKGGRLGMNKEKSYLPQCDTSFTDSVDVSQTLANVSKRYVTDVGGSIAHSEGRSKGLLRYKPKMTESTSSEASSAMGEYPKVKHSDGRAHSTLSARGGNETDGSSRHSSTWIDRKIRQNLSENTSPYERMFHFDMLYENSCPHSFNLFEGCGNVVTTDFRYLLRKLHDRHFETHARRLVALTIRNSDCYRSDTAHALALALTALTTAPTNCCHIVKSLETWMDGISVMHGKLLDLFRHTADHATTVRHFYAQWNRHVGEYNPSDVGDKASSRENFEKDPKSTAFDENTLGKNSKQSSSAASSRRSTDATEKASPRSSISKGSGYASPPPSYKSRRYSAPNLSDVPEKKFSALKGSPEEKEVQSDKHRRSSIEVTAQQRLSQVVPEGPHIEKLTVLQSSLPYGDKSTSAATPKRSCRGRQLKLSDKAVSHAPSPPSNGRLGSFHLYRVRHEKTLQKQYEALVRNMVMNDTTPAHMYNEAARFLREQESKASKDPRHKASLRRKTTLVKKRR